MFVFHQFFTGPLGILILLYSHSTQVALILSFFSLNIISRSFKSILPLSSSSFAPKSFTFQQTISPHQFFFLFWELMLYKPRVEK